MHHISVTKYGSLYFADSNEGITAKRASSTNVTTAIDVYKQRNDIKGPTTVHYNYNGRKSNSNS